METTISFEEFNRGLDLEPIKFSLAQVEEGPGWSVNKAEMLETWYRRFLYLVRLCPEKVIVPTKDIDTFWHTHILDTQKYMADCEVLFGRYFHHFPYFGRRGDEDRRNLEKAFSETDELFLKHFADSPLQSGIADCGALCNEPTPKNNDHGLNPDVRPTLGTVPVRAKLASEKG